MKTAVGVVATTIITAMVATGASAEWRLYVNRDNRAWSLERAYLSNDECDRAARTLYRSGQALGVGCAEYPQPISAQPSTPRVAEYSRPNPTSQRPAGRVDESGRLSASRTSAPRVVEYPARASAPRSAAIADPLAASPSHPAAVIFPPTGGIEIRSEEASRPAAVTNQPAAEPRPQAAQMVAQRNAEDQKAVAAVVAVKAASEAAAREAAAAADKAARRTGLAVFGGVALVIATGVAYSVYRAARMSPLRALAVCLTEVGLLTAALAYPVAEMWARFKMSDSIVLSPLPGLFAGLVVAGSGVTVLALELTRKPARTGTINLGTLTAGVAERKPQAPVEPLRPVEQARAVEPVKPVEPVRPLQPIRPLEPVKPIEPPKPVEAVKPPDAPAPVGGGS